MFRNYVGDLISFRYEDSYLYGVIQKVRKEEDEEFVDVLVRNRFYKNIKEEDILRHYGQEDSNE